MADLAVLVELEDAEAHAVQAALTEGVVEERGDGLGSVALVPLLRMPHYDGELRRGVRLADVHEAEDAYGLPLVLEMDGKGVVSRGVFSVFEEPFDCGRVHGSR